MNKNRFSIHDRTIYDRTIYDIKLEKFLYKIRNYFPSKEEMLRNERKQKMKKIFDNNL